MHSEITDKYKNKDIVKKIRTEIEKEAQKKGEKIKILHVCGTHEHEVARWGIRSLLPKSVEVIAGPGCPVCVCSAQDIDEVLWVAGNHNAIIATFGDMMRVPSSTDSLYQAQGKGMDIRVVYSISDAIELAKKNKNQEVIFFSVGFETTACTTAAEIIRTNLPNFSIYSSHKLIPPAMDLLLQRKDIAFDGYLAPGHVSVIIGTKPYDFCVDQYNFPVAVAGFEPVDILNGIYSVIKQIVNKNHKVDNVYKRYVTYEGNITAQKIMEEAFEISSARWRGLGEWPNTGYEIREKYAKIDTKKKFNIPRLQVKDLKQGCKCDEVLIGKSKPNECKLFMKACTPEHPIGACMVSHEGTCNIAATLSDL